MPLPIGELEEVLGVGRWRAAEFVDSGQNEHFRVHTDKGVWFVRRCEAGKPVPELRGQLALAAALHERGLPVPVAAPTRTGEGFAVVDGRLYVATAALPGGGYDQQNPTHLRAAGVALATLHEFVADLGFDLLPPCGRVPLPESLGTAIEAATVCVGQDPLLDRAAAWQNELATLWPGLRPGLVHGGWRRSSLLFDAAGLTAVLDLDSARADVLALDLAVAVVDFGQASARSGSRSDTGLDLARVGGFAAAYRRRWPGGDDSTAWAAVPALVAAKRLRRALRLLCRARAGSASANHTRRLRHEVEALEWLELSQARLVDTCLLGTEPGSTARVP